MKLSILIPIYNEKDTILDVIKKCETVNLSLLNFEKEIIIIDDGSTDGTRKILEQNVKNHKVIFHQQNQGKGAAIRSGLNHATGDYLIIQDADLEYDPNDYLPIIKCALEKNAAVVYGSRFLTMQKNKKDINYFGRFFLTKFANFLYHINISDINTCYKLFKTDLIKSFNLTSKKFEFCAEVTAKTAKTKNTIYEVPVNYFPRDKKGGKKLKWFKDGFQFIYYLVLYKFQK